MYIERDAKILLIYRSIYGIIIFIVMYLVMLLNQQRFLHPDFSLIQAIIFSTLIILAIILTLSSYSLKKEIAKQHTYLKEQKKTPKESEEKTVQIAYDKSGLYILIIAAVLGIIGLLYLYGSLILQAPSDISFQKGTLQTVSVMLFSIILILFVVLVISLKILLKRIQEPLYYEYKSCPRWGDLTSTKSSIVGGADSSPLHFIIKYDVNNVVKSMMEKQEQITHKKHRFP